MTRRETLVQVLRGKNGYSLTTLNETLAVEGVTEFLAEAQALGISNTDLADRLVAFKQGGGSGLANAIVAIRAEFSDTNGGSVECQDELASIKSDLEAVLGRVNAALGA